MSRSSNLVPKQIVDKNGKHTTVMVNPTKGVNGSRNVPSVPTLTANTPVDEFLLVPSEPEPSQDLFMENQRVVVTNDEGEKSLGEVIKNWGAETQHNGKVQFTVHLDNDDTIVVGHDELEPWVPQGKTQQEVFNADLERVNRGLESMGAVIEFEDGSKGIDPEKASQALINTYSSLLSYGYANGLLDSPEQAAERASFNQRRELISQIDDNFRNMNTEQRNALSDISEKINDGNWGTIRDIAHFEIRRLETESSNNPETGKKTTALLNFAEDVYDNNFWANKDEKSNAFFGALSTVHDAARALAARDFIGGKYSGWNQEAYDHLTRPYREVFGQLHPDDELKPASWDKRPIS